MASNVKPHQRAFALTIALIFLVTTVATSVFVVMAIIDENKNKNSLTEQTTDPLAAQNQLANTCVSEGTQAALAAPEVYKPAADVTALEKTDLQEGTGAVAAQGDCLVVKYYGTLATTGEKFDESFTTEDAFAFKLGTGSVIPGWDQGLEGLKVGGTRRLVIPSELAYGATGQGTIPANADLVFVVKLLEIKK